MGKSRISTELTVTFSKTSAPVVLQTSFSMWTHTLPTDLLSVSCAFTVESCGLVTIES